MTVVGIKFDWLKIAPPEGSFCYVAKAYVEKRGDGSVGRVNNQANVRVGSSLNAMKTKVSAKLEPGQDVAIIGEQDEYFKIKPPKDVYLYVNKQFVDPVKQVATAGGAVRAVACEQLRTDDFAIIRSIQQQRRRVCDRYANDRAIDTRHGCRGSFDAADRSEAGP